MVVIRNVICLISDTHITRMGHVIQLANGPQPECLVDSLTAVFSEVPKVIRQLLLVLVLLRFEIGRVV